MSEMLPGMPAPPPAARTKDAVAVILVRLVDGSPEVFWVKRGAALSFAGGYYAFPGGRLDGADEDVPVATLTGKEAAYRVCAVRELFEETGVLVADGASNLSVSQRSAFRRALLEKTRSFADLLTDHKLTIDPSRFKPAGRWITPTFLPARYDARLFLVELPPGETTDVWPGELAEGGWVNPGDALARWEAGNALLHPPNLHALQSLARWGPKTSQAEVIAELTKPSGCVNHVPMRIEFQRGIRLFPLETPTLPPATHTNCYLLGTGDLLIVDPGAAEVRQYARLLALVGALKTEGVKPLAIVLTHHHADHIGGAQAVAERLHLPVWCHPRTADRLPFEPNRLLNEGDVLALDGPMPMKFVVLHTPGHARGHICLIDQASRGAVVGDMVAGTGTIVIDPPEGNMGDYLAQLERLRKFPVSTLYPAHGPAIADGPAKLTEYLEHRRKREQLVLGAIGRSGSTIGEIVTKAYVDVADFLHPIAARSTEAVLIEAQREGRVQKKGDRYHRSS